MRRAPLAIAALIANLAFIPDVLAQACPPRTGMPANWCVPHNKYGVPSTPMNSFTTGQPTYPQPSYSQPPQTSFSPSPPNYAGVPAAPGIPLSAMQWQQPQIPYPPPAPQEDGGPVYAVRCFVDQVNYCDFGAPYQPPSGASCHCGSYSGITQ
jgi:hypothetical protein